MSVIVWASLLAGSVGATKYDHWWDTGDCYENDAVGVHMSVGVAVSHRLAYSRWGGAADTAVQVNNIFNKVNEVFDGQLNVIFNVTVVYIGDGTEMFDNSNCLSPIIDTFYAFNVWSSARPEKVALWHMLDDCFIDFCSDVCTAGLTFTNNRPCKESYNTAITYETGSTWSTVAHEIGHNLGADHSFDNGKGTTGGLMDYFDDSYLGLPQFNTNYARDELCHGVSNAFDLCGTNNSYITYKNSAPREPHDHNTVHPTVMVTAVSSVSYAWWYFVVGSLIVLMATTCVVLGLGSCRTEYVVVETDDPSRINF